MSTTKTATKKKTTHRVKPAASRSKAFTDLENKIIQDGVDHGVSKAMAVNQLRQWEKDGETAESIASRLRVNGEEVGKPSKTLGNLTPGEKQADIDAMLDGLFGESAEDADDDDEDDKV